MNNSHNQHYTTKRKIKKLMILLVSVMIFSYCNLKKKNETDTLPLFALLVSTASTTTVPPKISISNTNFIFYQGVTIDSIVPTLEGLVTSCSASPSLPPGLDINDTTCIISGTPTSLNGATNYIIEAQNSSGKNEITITISVISPPTTTISYTGSPFILTPNISLNLTPNLTAIGITGCTSSPNLPSGILINNSTCVISGSSSIIQNPTSYTITVNAAGGTATANINITIGKRIFVTAATSNGNFANGFGVGIIGADAFCMADANKPPTGNYKALLTDGTLSPNRKACQNASCSSGPNEGIDWVLSASTRYYRTDLSTLIGTTTANKIFTFSLTNAIASGASSGQIVWMDLFSDWRSGTQNCQKWTSQSNLDMGGIVDPTSVTNAAISGGSTSCNALRKLYCVEQ